MRCLPIHIISTACDVCISFHRRRREDHGWWRPRNVLGLHLRHGETGNRVTDTWNPLALQISTGTVQGFEEAFSLSLARFCVWKTDFLHVGTASQWKCQIQGRIKMPGYSERNHSKIIWQTPCLPRFCISRGQSHGVLTPPNVRWHNTWEMERHKLIRVFAGKKKGFNFTC